MRCLTASLLALLLAAGCGAAARLDDCTNDTHCFVDSGYICDTELTNMCLRRCEPDNSCLASQTCCLASQTCDLLTDQSFGVCRQRAADGGGG